MDGNEPVLCCVGNSVFLMRFPVVGYNSDCMLQIECTSAVVDPMTTVFGVGVQVLDPALTRPGRLSRRVVVPLPDEAGRADILAVHLRKTPMLSDAEKDLCRRQIAKISSKQEDPTPPPLPCKTPPTRPHYPTCFTFPRG